MYFGNEFDWTVYFIEKKLLAGVPFCMWRIDRLNL